MRRCHGCAPPIVRTWTLVHLLNRTLSPAAEALRCFLLEHDETHLVEKDRV